MPREPMQAKPHPRQGTVGREEQLRVADREVAAWKPAARLNDNK